MVDQPDRRIPRALALIVLMAGLLTGGYFSWVSHLAYEEVVVRTALAAEETERKLASTDKGVPLFSLDEVFANLSGKDSKNHSLGVKLEIELFADDARALIEQRQSGIKNVIIETAAEQEYEQLNTVAGKLYFKELMVARTNEFFHRAIVRDLHFSSFFLQ